MYPNITIEFGEATVLIPTKELFDIYIGYTCICYVADLPPPPPPPQFSDMMAYNNEINVYVSHQSIQACADCCSAQIVSLGSNVISCFYRGTELGMSYQLYQTTLNTFILWRESLMFGL